MDRIDASVLCLCPGCPTFVPCDEPPAFCLADEGDSVCIGVERGCICNGCLVHDRLEMEEGYYCTQGSEALQAEA